MSDSTSARKRAPAKIDTTVNVSDAAVWMHPDELHPWEDNPRQNHDSVARVVASIQRFGFGAPIVARKENREIIAGHTRWFAARQLGLTSVPVRLLEITEYEAHLLALTDNRLTELTPWDDERLAQVLARYELPAVNLAGWEEVPTMPLGPPALDDADADDGSRPLSFDVFSIAAIADAQVAAMLGTKQSDYAPSVGDVMCELNRCSVGGKPSVRCADRWFPHRYDVLAGASKHTPNETLTDSAALRGVVETSARTGVTPDTMRILQTAQIYHGRQAARQFPIHVARDVYRKYSRQNARVLDPCAGWGGRLLGWLCARQAGSYFGVDASSRTVESFGSMIAELGIANASVIHSAFETVILEPASFDFAFTSPPYFNVERYSNDPEQSFVRYPDYPTWRLGFLEPLVRLTLAALRPGCAFALNVSDAQSHTIAKDAREIALALGASVELEAKLDVGGGSSGAMNMASAIKEDLLVLRAPAAQETAPAPKKAKRTRAV